MHGGYWAVKKHRIKNSNRQTSLSRSLCLNHPKPKPEDIFHIPYKKDGAPLAYKYNVSFSLSDVGISDIFKNQPQLIAKQIDQDIHLFSGDIDLGVLIERADMVSDWLRRGDPYLAVVNQVINESCHITLAFYRDKQKQYEGREQTVTALTGYKAEQKQDTITCLTAGDVIGSLPKKYAVRFIKEGAALIIFDHYDEDEDTFIAKPFVKIYW